MTAATLTRIAAFSPLLFWPGIVGQFMKYLPITLIATLSASLVTALIFTPTLGALIGKAAPQSSTTRRRATASTCGRCASPSITRGTVMLLAIALLIGVPVAYGKLGTGVEFFPDVEPDTGVVLVHARGNLSLAEKDRLVRTVEAHVLDDARADDGLRALRRHGPGLGRTSPRTSSARSSSSSSTGRSGGRPRQIMDEIRADARRTSPASGSR